MRDAFMIFAIALALSMSMVVDAFAQVASGGAAVGGSLLADIQSLISGRVGMVIGLAISLFGLWMWLVQQSAFGVVIVIAGAALTAFPGLYGSLTSAFRSAFGGTGAGPSATSGGSGVVPGRAL